MAPVLAWLSFSESEAPSRIQRRTINTPSSNNNSNKPNNNNNGRQHFSLALSECAAARVPSGTFPGGPVEAGFVPTIRPYTAEDTAARGGVLWQDLEDGALKGVKAVRKVEESARREESGSREREGGSGSFTLYPTALYSFKVVDSGFS